MAPIRVHITDDHAVFRCGLKTFIDQEPDLMLVSEATEAAETAAQIRANQPHVAILSHNTLERVTLSVARNLVAEHPTLALLILTNLDRERYLREFMHIGVRGLAIKSRSGTDLMDAIRRVHRGERFIDPSLARSVLVNYAVEKAGLEASAELLTGREREVCQYLATGCTNREVAEMLSISRRTVEAHRAAIISKTGLRTRAALVLFALENGLLPQNRSPSNLS